MSPRGNVLPENLLGLYFEFSDEGCVKLGVLPNEQMGQVLIPARTYSIVVDSA